MRTPKIWMLVLVTLALLEQPAFSEDTLNRTPARIDINTATVKEFMALPGIDTYRARMIDAYRYTYGSFKSVDELRRVPDITDEIFGRVQSYLYVDSTTISGPTRVPRDKGHPPRRPGWTSTDRPAAGKSESKPLLWRDARRDIRKYDLRLRNNPRDTEALFHRGFLYMAFEKYTKALENFDRLIEIDSRSADAYAIRGFTYVRQQRKDAATRDLDQALNCRPATTDAWNHRATLAMMLGRFESAVSDYTESLKRNPKQDESYLGRAQAKYFLGKWEEARQDLDRAFRLNRHHPHVPAFRCFIYLAEGNAQAAAWWARRTIKTDLPAEEFSILGILGYLSLRMSGLDGKADQFLDMAARQNRKKWPAPVVRYLQGDSTETEVLRQAKDTDQLTEAHTYIGLNLMPAGRAGEAKTHFEWVQSNGSPVNYEYPLAVSELRRLNSKPKPRP